MPIAAFANLGCKVNQYETDKLVDSFAARGFEIGEFDQPADVYVINTCSVTGAADRKSRQMARRAARQKIGARVVLTGCFAQLALDTDESVDGAALLVPNREKMRLAEITLAAFPDLLPRPDLCRNSASERADGGPAPALGSRPGAAQVAVALGSPVPVSRVRHLARQPSGEQDSKRTPATSEAAPGSLRRGQSRSDGLQITAVLESDGGGPAVFPEQAGPIPLSALAGSRPSRLCHTRATLKVQDGCEHYCAFCSIPYTRNTMASRSLAAVVDEARQMAQSGTREVVVTGVCVGAYRDPETGVALAGLLRAVSESAALDRIRLSSLQPIETDDDLIDAVATASGICPHLHLSLQSGDDAVLARMQRPYDTAYYRELVARLRARIPGIAITTDIIVGFPGETEAMFANTLRFASEIGFSRTHVFRYSPRERTYAHREFCDDVSPGDKERRHKQLSEVCRRSQVLFAQSLIGRRVVVLIESRGAAPGMMAGYTDTYVRVNVPAAPDASGKMVLATIASVEEGGDAVASDAEVGVEHDA